MKNKITDLRNHLFETIEMLKDTEKPMELGRAKAIADVAQVIINSAKVEVAFLEATGAQQVTDFIEPLDTAPRAPMLERGRPNGRT